MPDDQWARIVTTIMRIDWFWLIDASLKGGSDQTLGGGLIDVSFYMQFQVFVDEHLYDILLQIVSTSPILRSLYGQHQAFVIY